MRIKTLVAVLLAVAVMVIATTSYADIRQEDLTAKRRSS
jgi:hypothetical protein